MKQFAIRNGIDVASLDTHTYTERSRSSKKHFSGSDKSIPIPPPADKIKTEWKRLISNGEIKLGLTCTVQTLVTKDGKIITQEVKISG